MSAPTDVRAVSPASLRLRALAALSGSLTDALSPEAAADLVQRKALSALEATSAIVVTLGAFPPPAITSPSPPDPVEATTLHVVHAIGLPDEVKAAVDALPLDAPVPFAEVAREGQPLFLASADEMRRFPDWADGMLRAGAKSAAIVPVWANGELRGVLGLAWPAPHLFDEDERAFVLTLGVMCAQAIMRAHLKAAEVEARRDAERARETAEGANASKAHFLATISHELRTPVNAVIGYSALLSDELYGPVSPLQRDHIGRMSASGQHLLGLIEDLLGHARLDAGEEVVRPESVSLQALMNDSLDLIRPLAEQKALRLRMEVPPEPVELYTDARKLRQILVNLLGNAIKFTDAGDVVLLVRIEGVEPAVRVHFEVTDTGTGILPEELEHIFDPYWEHDASSIRPGGSTGLGLAVARTLARLLGGEISCERSAVGTGSTFLVTLPARYAKPDIVTVPLPLTVVAPALLQ